MSKRALDAAAKMYATLERMRDMMGRYSIEVVSGDGERSRAGVQAYVREGLAEWDVLVKELGREPLWAEMYGATGNAYDAEPVRPEGLP